MKRISLILISLLAMSVANSYAQFTDDVWPAWQHPRSSYAQVSQIYTSLVERWAVAANYVTAPNRPNVSLTAPSGFRLRRSDLVMYKKYLKSTITGFSSATKTPEQIVDWFNVTTSSIDYSVEAKWTVNNFCYTYRLPTNYFDYTPWRCLSGVGPYTEDSSVGHAHGATNAYTASGGSYFPPGRTRWYTTDYGFDSMRTVTNLNKLIKWETAWESHSGSVLSGFNYGYSAASFADAVAAAIAAVPYITRVFGSNYTTSRQEYNGISMLTYYTANAYYSSFTSGVSVASSVEADVYAMFMTYMPAAGNGTMTYDPWNTGYTRRGFWPTSSYVNKYGWQLSSDVVAIPAGANTHYILTVGSQFSDLQWDYPPALALPVVTATIGYRGYRTGGSGLDSSSYPFHVLYMFDWTDRFSY